MKKIPLTEENSISTNILSLVNEIKDVIIEDMKEQPIKGSQNIPLTFKEGKFKLAFDGQNSFIDNIILSYTISLVRNEEEYELAIQDYESELNSSYDEDTRELKIISCAINGELSKDFTEPIIHEITHMYQYAKGMNKKVDLYDKVSNLLGLGRKNLDAYYIGLALYYTFPHEQDAFAHQYYMKHDGDIESFEPYRTFKTAINIVKNNYQNSRMQKAIHYLEYDNKNYLKRLHFGLKRFEKKLKNVNIFLDKENNSKQINAEATIKKFKPWTKLFEQYNGKIEFANEQFFNFKKVKRITLTEEELANIISTSIKKYLI